MRIDKFLKVSRLIKRRSVANEACDAGRIHVNDKVVKASYLVEIGDIIKIKFGSNVTVVEIISLKESIRKEEASSMYKHIQDIG